MKTKLRSVGALVLTGCLGLTGFTYFNGTNGFGGNRGGQSAASHGSASHGTTSHGTTSQVTASNGTGSHGSADYSQLAADPPGLYSVGIELTGDPTSDAIINDVIPNTNSVLFPMHNMDHSALEAQMASYIATFQDLTPQDFTVRRSLHVRANPGKFHESQAMLHTGAKVTVDGKSGSWYRLADGSGYVLATDLIDPNLPSDVVWTMDVVNAGDSETINECAGGLTLFNAMTDELGVPAWAMHSYCGGEPILALELDDVVQIDGDRYQVISINDFPLFGSTELMRDLTAEDAFMQACDLAQGYSHMVGLKSLSAVNPSTSTQSVTTN